MSRRLPRGAQTVMLVVTVLLGGWLLASPAAASDSDPKPPAPDSLTDKNAGGVSVEKQGSRVAVQADLKNAYLYVFPEDEDPVGVGWLDFAEGQAGVDLALMPAGEVTIALLDADGKTVGWASTELSEEESNASPADEEESGLGIGWLWIIAPGVVVLLALVWWLRRRLAGGRRVRGSGDEASEGKAVAP